MIQTNTHLPHSVIFLQVKNSKDKLLKIFQLTLHFFNSKRKICLFTPNTQANTYLDNLLWSFQKDSFVPHSTPLQHDEFSPILISNDYSQVRAFPSILNLTQTPIDLLSHHKRIFELEDFSSEKQKELNKRLYQFYRQKGCQISTA